MPLGIGREDCLLVWVWDGRLVRLDWTIGVMMESAVRSGVPSLLGRRGGTGLVTGLGAICRSSDATFITSLAGAEEDFDGLASTSFSSDLVFLWNF